MSGETKNLGPLAEAVRETAVPQALELVTDLARNLLDPVTKQTGELLADYVRDLREKRKANAMAVVQRGREIVGESPVSDLASIPAQRLVPLLEAASLAEDETLREMWASLLATSLTVEAPETMSASYVEILRQLSPFDARVLNGVFIRFGWPRGGAVYVGGQPEPLGDVSTRDFGLSLHNLRRLGLVELGTRATERFREISEAVEELVERERARDSRYYGHQFWSLSSREKPPSSGSAVLSRLGHDFLLSCMPPRPRPVQTPVDEDSAEQTLREWIECAHDLRLYYIDDEPDLAQEFFALASTAGAWLKER
ncbi:MAG: Abi-alpha family protein [Gemmatimonadota bacterium]